MQFTVPQFIDRQPKIFGPFSFTQFIYMGGGGVICLMLYFSLAKTKLLVFVFITIIIMSISTALAFLKVGGRSLPTLIKNFFFFTLAPKIYLWRRKNVPPRMIKMSQEKTKPSDLDGSSSLKLSDRSQLRNLLNIIETKK
jgi:hypothetical protein